MARQDESAAAYLRAVALAAVAISACSKAIPPECAGPPLQGAEQYEAAMAAGYEINRFHKCIDKASFDRVNAELERGKELRRANRPAFPTRDAGAR